MTKIIVVKAALDPEAGVWFVESSDMPGLSLEAESIESLLEKLPAAVSDLMYGDEGAVGDDNGHDVPIELIAHASTRVRLPPQLERLRQGSPQGPQGSRLLVRP